MTQVASMTAFLHALRNTAAKIKPHSEAASVLTAEAAKIIEDQAMEMIDLAGIFIAADEFCITLLDKMPADFKEQLNADTDVSDAFENLYGRIVRRNYKIAKLKNEEILQESLPTQATH